ncbi:hypothetical protein V5799_008599 [Amblyomma americanum]|uniref:Major facilitator superfamily associated domain-containing protein n=1 Tax=Amblyomma americanum TaxID=6943 RepID=A0AAQ4FEH4_AMBAM
MSVYNVRSAQTVATAFFSLDAAAWACLDPFVPVFMRHHGLSALQTGTVLSVAAILSGLFVPAALWIPKWRRNSWRSVLVASSVVSIVCFMSVLAIPPTSGGSEWVSPCAADKRESHADVLEPSNDVTPEPVPSGNLDDQDVGGAVRTSVQAGQEGAINGTPQPMLSSTYEQLPTAVPQVAPLAHLAPFDAMVEGRHSRVRREATLPQRAETVVSATPAKSAVLPANASASSPLVKTIPNATTIPAEVIPTKDKKGISPVATDRDCQGEQSSPDCLVTNLDEGGAGSQSIDPPFENTALLLLLASAVVLGSSTFALAKFVADESYFGFLDEIDATEKSRSHETYAAVVTALVLGAVAILAAQTPCLPLPTWGYQEVYLAAFGTLVFASLPLAAFFPEPHQPLRRQATSGAFRGVGTALKNVEGGLVTGGLFFLGTLAGLEQTFFMWHLEETGKKVELGVVLMARAVSNVASMFLLCAGGLPSRLLAWLAFGIICVSARCACYVQSGWELAAVAQLLSPPSTVLMWVACERWARRSSTRLSTERGLLIIMRCCHNGLGFCVGALSGGGVAAWLGVRSTLGVAAVVGLIGGLAMLAASRFVATRPPSYDRLLWDPTSPNSDSDSEEEYKPGGDAGVAMPAVLPTSPVAS